VKQFLPAPRLRARGLAGRRDDNSATDFFAAGGASLIACEGMLPFLQWGFARGLGCRLMSPVGSDLCEGLSFEFIVFRRDRAQESRFCFQPIVQVMARLAASLLENGVGQTRDVFAPQFIRVCGFADHKVSRGGED
jgi:hypothetical protein